MTSKLKVEITSFALSSILGDNATCDGDQEGFLFGEAFKKTGRDITDADADGETETTIIRISSHMPLITPCEFYTASGAVTDSSLLDCLGPFMNSVVGYYDFKRNMPIEYSNINGNRMNLMFNNLCNWHERFSKDLGTIQAPLTFLQLRQSHISIGTISNTYCFYILNSERKFTKIASEIPNLGDTSQRNYLHTPGLPSVDTVVKPFLIKTPLKSEDMPAVNAHNAMMKELEKVAKSVAQKQGKFLEMHTKLLDLDNQISEALKEHKEAIAMVEQRQQQSELIETNTDDESSLGETKKSISVPKENSSQNETNSIVPSTSPTIRRSRRTHQILKS